VGDALRQTPLHERHVEAGARMVPFAGWHMPVLYGSIVEEHTAVRRSAGLFDVSHMGELRLRGPQAAALAQRLLSNDVLGAPIGRVRYGLLCQEHGGVVDDVTAYRVAEDEVLLCVNASNIAADLEWVRKVHAQSDLDCEVVDESDATALLAIQGPAALEITGGLVEDEDPAPRRWRFREARLAGIPVWLSRTGYTGEDGYEIFSPAQHAVALWDALVAAGGDRLSLAGLGARDTLRTEMAYPLYGHELDLERNPLEAGLERFVRFGAGFIGEPALEAPRTSGPAERLVGLLVEGRAVPRPGFPIVADRPVGTVTSGTFAPSVERSIAMGYVPADLAEPGTRLAIEIRGRQVPCTVTETPFYNRKS
jgi:aminomethyltransferase